MYYSTIINNGLVYIFKKSNNKLVKYSLFSGNPHGTVPGSEFIFIALNIFIVSFLFIIYFIYVQKISTHNDL